MYYIADTIKWKITEVDEDAARIVGNVLVSETDQALYRGRYSVDNGDDFTFVKWFPNRPAAVRFMAERAEKGLPQKEELLAQLKAEVACMKAAITEADVIRTREELRDEALSGSYGGTE